MVEYNQQTPAFYLYRDSSSLEKYLLSCDRVFIDIPIGLSTSKASRDCDRLLRKRIGTNFRSSVFNPPVRDALNAMNYKRACEINEKKSGKRISIQTWNIIPKIRQIDKIMSLNPSLRSTVLECHPEFCFRLLNHDIELEAHKKTTEGQNERIHILSKYFPDALAGFNFAMNQFKRKDVARDDILDAMALACFSHISIKKGLFSLPEVILVDEQQLPMAIHYTIPDS